MVVISEVMVDKKGKKDFEVTGDVIGELDESSIILTGSDKRLKRLSGNNVSFTMTPRGAEVKIGYKGKDSTSIDLWRVPTDCPAPVVRVNLVNNSGVSTYA